MKQRVSVNKVKQCCQTGLIKTEFGVSMWASFHSFYFIVEEKDQMRNPTLCYLKIVCDLSGNTKKIKVHNERLRVEVGTEIASLQRPHFITCSFIICRLHHLPAPHAHRSTLYKNCQPAGINHPLSDTPLIPVNPPCMETWWARRLNEGGWKNETLKRADMDKPARRHQWHG